MFWDIIWVFVSLITQPSHECLATNFGSPGDRHAGGKAVCVGRKVGSDDIGVAHRSLPCGTKVVVYLGRTKRAALATVIDRGPYGATLDGVWFVKKTKDEPGKWRGCLDMTPRLAKILGHNGLEKVRFTPVVQRKGAASTRR